MVRYFFICICIKLSGWNIGSFIERGSQEVTGNSGEAVEIYSKRWFYSEEDAKKQFIHVLQPHHQLLFTCTKKGLQLQHEALHTCTFIFIHCSTYLLFAAPAIYQQSRRFVRHTVWCSGIQLRLVHLGVSMKRALCPRQSKSL